MRQNVFKNNIYIIFGFAISILCLFLLFRGIQWSQVFSNLGKANWGELILATLFHFLSLLVAVFRWKMVINLPEVSLASISKSMMVGLMVNNILPGRLGEFVRAIMLGQEVKKSKTFFFATIVTDRLFDLLVLVILGLLSFIMFPLLPWGRHMLFFGGLLLIVGISIIYLLGDSTIGPKIENIFSKWESSSIYKIIFNVVRNLRLGFASIQTIRRGTVVFIFSCLIWGVWFLSLYFALNAFNLMLPLGGMVLLLSSLNLVGLIPSSPGYAGTYHLLAVAVLSTFAINKEDALGFILVFHALWYFPQTIIGVVILTMKNLRLVELVRKSF